CEYTVVHSGCAVKITKDAPLDKVCLLSCGTAAGLGAAWNVADVTKGSTVANFGLGTVGLSVAQGAKIRGASRIIGVDTNPEKSEKAKAFGVTDFINPNDIDETVQQVIKRITDGGADYSFECIGDTEMITTALQSCCDGWGVTVTLGVPKVKPEVTAHYGLFLTGRTLKGISESNTRLSSLCGLEFRFSICIRLVSVIWMLFGSICIRELTTSSLVSMICHLVEVRVGCCLEADASDSRGLLLFADLPWFDPAEEPSSSSSSSSSSLSCFLLRSLTLTATSLSMAYSFAIKASIRAWYRW
ncbi:alcohol dehydrogenase-like 6 protein, partial [Tanacetum coccineum]